MSITSSGLCINLFILCTTDRKIFILKNICHFFGASVHWWKLDTSKKFLVLVSYQKLAQQNVCELSCQKIETFRKELCAIEVASFPGSGESWHILSCAWCQALTQGRHDLIVCGYEWKSALPHICSSVCIQYNTGKDWEHLLREWRQVNARWT